MDASLKSAPDRASSLHLFGKPGADLVDAIVSTANGCAPDLMVVLDSRALWDPDTIEKLASLFPTGIIDQSKLLLALTECIANAAQHGRADALGIWARMRHGILLISFMQLPLLCDIVRPVLARLRDRPVTDIAIEAPGGLGFPILIRLARCVALGKEGSCLQLWFRTGIAKPTL